MERKYSWVKRFKMILGLDRPVVTTTPLKKSVVFERKPGSQTLDAFLNELIADHDGIRPEEVTLDYIRRQRMERFYPTARYVVDSNMGGYSTIGLSVPTRCETDARELRVDEFLKSLK